MADVNNDGRADIVGFAGDGVYVSLSTSTAEEPSFAEPLKVVDGFGQNAGGWRVQHHPRFMADVNNDGRDDIVGLASDGVYVSLSTSTADEPSFQAPVHVASHFGVTAGGWVGGKHPRMMADVNGDGREDIVGFSSIGVIVMLSASTAIAPKFQTPMLVVSNFGHDAGSWWAGLHPRTMADVNADGTADIVGFGGDGAWVFISSRED